MQNNINSNLSFRANIEPLFEVSNPKRFANINKLVKAGTKKFPKEKLYLSKPQGREVLSAHIMKKTVNGKSVAGETDEIITPLLDEQMNFLTDEQIADRFIAYLKVLVGAKKARPSLDLVEDEIQEAKKLIKAYKRKVEALEGSGSRAILYRYKALLERKYATLEKLTKKRSKAFKDFIKQRAELIKKYPEVAKVDIF